MKAKVAATLILLYAVILFVECVRGALLGGDFSISTIPLTGILFIGPAIGIFRRVNWCRIFLGIWSVFAFLIFLVLPFRYEFHFRPAYLGFLLVTGLPVFLLFFYPPLKNYTQNVSRPETNA